MMVLLLIVSLISFFVFLPITLVADRQSLETDFEKYAAELPYLSLCAVLYDSDRRVL